jgi:m7GpppX diphosphatase
VQESPKMYESVVRPYINSLDPKRTDWSVSQNDVSYRDWLTLSRRVRNILNGTAEVHKILHSSPSFVILPDMKWDSTISPLDKLYLVAFAKDPQLGSLRDLRGEHLPLLQEIKDAAESCATKLGLKKGGIMCFFHYQPSYCMRFPFSQS